MLHRMKKHKIHSFAKGANFKLTNKNKIMQEKMEHDLEDFYSLLYNGKVIWVKC